MGWGDVSYTRINRGHSVGQELEYCVLNEEGNLPNYKDISKAEREIARMLGLGHGRNTANIYIDCDQIELCSAPHPDIASLYEEMQRMHGAMQSVVSSMGFRVAETSYTKTKHSQNYSGNHVHIGYSFMQREKILEAMIAYLPLFIAISNNSPTQEFPKGSQRLREGLYSNTIIYPCRHVKSPSMIYANKDFPTVEVRCMDRGRTKEEDVANAAFVFATAEMLKKEIGIWRRFSKKFNAPEWTFESLYGFHSRTLLKDVMHITNISARQGLDASVHIGEHEVNLGEIARRHYAGIQDMLKKIDVPEEIKAVLDGKLTICPAQPAMPCQQISPMEFCNA